tara:strand:- start:2237 stop:3460 length:1224 start_codon:yes stop_codon:yes gene_type:complete
MQALLLCPQYSTNCLTGPVKRTHQIKKLLEYCGYQVNIACKDPQSGESINQHGSRFNDLLRKCSLVYADAYHMASFRLRKRTQAFKLVDLYIPFFIEHRYSLPFRYSKDQLISRFQLDQAYLNEALYSGNAFLAAGDRQIDLYSGLMHLFDTHYDQNLPLLNLPFFLNPTARKNTKSENIHLAWLGGAWHWFDLVSVIKLLKVWLPENPNLKFSFVGIEHPTDSRLHNSHDIQAAKSLVAEFPNQVQMISWMNYQEYCTWLQNLDLAIVISKPGNESRFSIRTRFCELLERQIPIICNSGDYFSDWIQKYRLGQIVSNENLLQSLNYWKNNLSIEASAYKDIYKAHSFDSVAPRFKRFLNFNHNLKPKKNNPYLRLKPQGLYYRKHQIRKFSNNFIDKIRLPSKEKN